MAGRPEERVRSGRRRRRGSMILLVRADFLGFRHLLIYVVLAILESFPRGLQVGLAGGFRAHGKFRYQLLIELLAMAGGTFEHCVPQHQQLEYFAAIAASVIVNRHGSTRRIVSKLAARRGRRTVVPLLPFSRSPRVAPRARRKAAAQSWPGRRSGARQGTHPHTRYNFFVTWHVMFIATPRMRLWLCEP